VTVPDFTVLIPTHDHADTLRYAVRSVQWQTRQDFELFIVGDGVPDRTREIAAELVASDSRIRFFDFPKGERHGESYRHQLLQDASGRFVCYQSDDDLWFPEYLETMAALLEDHDLAHCMQIEVSPEGGVSSWMFDATVDPQALSKMRESKTGFGLNSGGHRMDAYRRLPQGWHPAPRGINTDLYFWLQFLTQPWCRYVSCKWPHVVHLSSVPRKNWEPVRRVDELATWWDRIQTASAREHMTRECLLPLHEQLLRDGFQTSGGGLAQEIARLAEAVRASAKPATGLTPYVLGEDLRFCAGGNASRFVLEGFSHSEAWGRWTAGPSANVVLPLADPVATDLLLELAILPLLHGELHPVCAFSVTLNGSVVLRIDETRGAINHYEVRVPRALCADASVLVLGIAVAEPARPVDIGQGTDERLLGLGLVTLRISATEAAGS
jgi:hypothetical protein